MVAKLSIGTSTTRISLLDPNGYHLERWTPGDELNEGIWQESQLADFRQLAAYRDTTTIDSFNLKLRGNSQDAAARQLQGLRAIIRTCLDFWTTTWETDVVYLEAQAECETNERYSVVYDARLAGEGNPFAQPFLQPGGTAVMEELILSVEHGPWLENAPGTGTAVEIGTTQTYDGRTVGNVDDSGAEELSTDAQTVFVANKHNVAQITNIHYYNGAVWSGNLMDAALPFNIITGGGGAGTQVTVFGIDTTVADSGPFSSLVFDIGDTLGPTPTPVWRYSNGGADPTAWAALTVQDNTDAAGAMTNWPLHTAGIGSVHWEQPAGWVTADPQVGAGPALGVTGYWVALHDTYVGPPGADSATQQNRDIYTVTWPYIDIDADQVDGDMPALLRFTTDTRSAQDGIGTTTDLWCQRVIAGLRDYGRGDDFTAYINIADEQNSAAISITLGGGTAYQSIMNAPAGRCARYTAAGVDAIDVRVYATVNEDFYGRFHAFVRGKQYSGVAGVIDVRLRYAPGDASQYADKVTVTRQFLNTNDDQLLDFGEITLGPQVSIYPNTMNNTYVNIECGASAAGSADLYELILIPVDEWAIDSEDMFKSTGASLYTNDYLTYLNVDAIQNQRQLLSHLHRISNDAIMRYWRPITNGIPILRSGKHQRLWLLSARFDDYADADDIRADSEICHTVQVWRNQRYTTLRGDQ